MKEKAFKQEYSLFVPQSTFTRAANKMLKDAAEVFGSFIYDEIKAAAEHIKKQEDFEPLDLDEKHTHTARGDAYGSAYTLETSDEYHILGGSDKDEYGEPTYCVDWYFFTVDRYTATIGGKKITATNHADFMRKQMEAKGEYRYFCTHRPPSLGCIPEGAVSFESYASGNRYIGEATYNRELTDEEAENWGLVLDTDYTSRRAYWLSEGGGND